MAAFKLILSPLYFQDFETVSAPLVGVTTSYHYLWATSQPTGGGVPDEIAAAIARGDLRWLPR